MSIYLRRLLLAVCFSALLPVAGSAGAFEELSSGRGQALLPAPSAAAAAGELRSSSKPHYLSLNGLDLRAVPAPPEDGSCEDNEDLRAVFDWQRKRTGAQCAAAQAEMNHSYDVFFGKISPFSSPAPVAVKKFFDNVSKDSVAAHKFLKDTYKRPRPFLRDPRLAPCLPRVQGYSYPSGHAAMARLFALILSDLEPSRRAEFMARADEAALNRVIGGVHHPSDIEAGAKLADTLFSQLKKQGLFMADLNALRPLLR